MQSSRASPCVEELPKAQVLPENEGKLVHFSGEAEVGDEDTVYYGSSEFSYASDPVFGQPSMCLMLRRDVSMFQWSEFEDEDGGVSYEKYWAQELILSDGFKESDGHENPGSIPFESATFYSDPITVGEFKIPVTLASGISRFYPLSIWGHISTSSIVDESIREEAIAERGGYFFGKNQTNPDIGDIRVELSIVTLDSNLVSVLAKQKENTLSPYQLESGEEIFLLTNGDVPAQRMVDDVVRDEQVTMCESSFDEMNAHSQGTKKYVPPEERSKSSLGHEYVPLDDETAPTSEEDIYSWPSSFGSPLDRDQHRFSLPVVLCIAIGVVVAFGYYKRQQLRNDNHRSMARGNHSIELA